MKKSIILVSALFLGISSAAIIPANEAEAATKYSSCKELNKAYKYGVKKSASTQNKVVNRKTKKATYQNSNATVDANLYSANQHLDNDSDGIACEK